MAQEFSASPTPPRDFYISYNHADQSWAEWIAWQVEDAGYSTVLEAWDFRPGANFVLEMQHAAATTGRTIVVLSPDYLDGYSQPSWAPAFVRDPTGEFHTLLPVRVRPCVLGGLLASVVYIDLVDLDEAGARAALLAGVRPGRVKPSLAPNYPGGWRGAASAPPQFPGPHPPLSSGGSRGFVGPRDAQGGHTAEVLRGGLEMVVPGSTSSVRPALVPARGHDLSTPAHDSGPLAFELSSPGPVYWVGRPATLGDSFVGRETEIEQLTRAIGAGKAIVISGGPGTGKTRLAAEVAHRMGGLGFWTNAGPTAPATIANLAPSLGVSALGRTEEELAEYVTREVCRLPGHLLWVVDNVRDLGWLTDLQVGAGSLDLLVTTRDGRRNLAAPDVAWLDARPLGRQPSMALLASRSPVAPSDADLTKLAEMVGGLPLALEMLAVRLGESVLTPERLLSELHEAPHMVQLAAFEQVAGLSVVRTEGIFRSITAALDRLGSTGRPRLSSVGYLADAPVPVALMAALVEVDERALARLLETGRRESVLSVTGDSITIHALTMAAIAATNVPGALSTALQQCERRLRTIHRSDPAALRAELPHYQNVFECARRALGVEAALPYAVDLAVAYRTAGHYRTALQLDEELLHVSSELYGTEHVLTITLRNSLAVDCRYVGRNEEAMRLNEETLLMANSILGTEHTETLYTRSNLAFNYILAHRYQDALNLDEETLQVRQRLFGAEHADTLVTRNNLANGYRGLGRYEYARQLDEENLTMRERALGREHPDTLRTRSNLASDYRSLRRTRDAILLDRTTLAIRERVLGNEHPETLRTRSNLALAYMDMGRHQDAIDMLFDMLPVVERVQGTEHPDTHWCRTLLTMACSRVSAGWLSGEDDDWFGVLRYMGYL